MCIKQNHKRHDKQISIIILSLYFILYSTSTSFKQIAPIWGVKLDPDSIGEKHNYFNSGHTTMPIQLPGTLDEAGYGTRTVGSDYGILTRRHKYIGPAWYTREFVIPHNWQGKEITLYLERVLWESKVWIDGRFIDTQEGLGTPH